MNAADQAFVFFSEHTLAMKKLAPISKEDIQNAFGHNSLTVFTNNETLVNSLKAMDWSYQNLLLMSSGTFNGLNLKQLSTDLI
jgi:UDP-N-acetylmuramate: L-alanyl-gamma-D-glutamyl-meso-diaminopimelate ligase